MEQVFETIFDVLSGCDVTALDEDHKLIIVTNTYYHFIYEEIRPGVYVQRRKHHVYANFHNWRMEAAELLKYYLAENEV